SSSTEQGHLGRSAQDEPELATPTERRLPGLEPPAPGVGCGPPRPVGVVPALRGPSWTASGLARPWPPATPAGWTGDSGVLETFPPAKPSPVTGRGDRSRSVPLGAAGLAVAEPRVCALGGCRADAAQVPWAPGGAAPRVGGDGAGSARARAGARQAVGALGRVLSAGPPTQVLLVFAKEDRQCVAFRRACGKAGFACSVAREAQAVLALFQDGHHDVIIMDLRSPRRLDAEALCRSIRSSKTSENTVIVGVVRRRPACCPCVLPLLAAGFTRRFVEDPSLMACHNEPQQLELGQVRSQLKLRACNSVFAALEKSQEAVDITSEDTVVQYANPAFESTVGCPPGELIGRKLAEEGRPAGHHRLLHQDRQDTTNAAASPQGWQGVHHAQNGENMKQNVKVIPVVGQGGKIRHYVSIIRMCTAAQRQVGAPWPAPAPAPGPVTDGASSHRPPVGQVQGQEEKLAGPGPQRRHSSIARIHSLTIEAPITKVIGLISAAREGSPVPVTEALDRVLQILRTSELYCPQFGAQEDDPHASDLVGGLVSDGLRRLSGSECVPATKSLPHVASARLSPHPALDIPPHIARAMENEGCWDFNIFELETATHKRPLVYLGLKTFARFGVCAFLNCSEATLRSWLQVIEDSYHPANPYHNSTHSADVLHATAYFLHKERVKQTLDPVDEAAALIAAAVHDVDHPGRTNSFLCNAGSALALLYNDMAVLESHHAALAFQLTTGDGRCNIFKNMGRSDYRVLRQGIIDMVLATEMTRHFEHVSKFVNSINKPLAALERDGVRHGGAGRAAEETREAQEAMATVLRTPENWALVRRMLIKCADVANPCRPREQCVEWAARISEEYFAQTEEEKLRGLPVVMPVFDRSTCSIPRAQLSFINYFVTDMFHAWDDLPDLMRHLDDNFKYWKRLDDMKLRSLRPPPE
ncbi:High affinity cAMP-specific and IBMX-insensitive 3',5'-cyclic phosphodiesterase 8A, partial [Galemys pyrenaicus]